jgi:sulfur carrier protein
MKIVLNGAWHDLALDAGSACAPAAATTALASAATPTLERVLAQLGFGDRTVATALNGEFIAVGLRAGTLVRDGDRLEVVAPMQGG